MKAKFKVGDRVVVSDVCEWAMGYGANHEFRGNAGVIAGVCEYCGLETDYDVIIDGHEAQDIGSCPGFEENWLTLESV